MLYFNCVHEAFVKWAPEDTYISTLVPEAGISGMYK